MTNNYMALIGQGDKMKRKEWQFEYNTKQVLGAARAKANHHAERLKWWEGQQAEVMAKMRESGIEISQSLAMQYGQTQANFAPNVSIKPDVQRELNECFQKISEHKSKQADYACWVEILSATNDGHNLSLDHDDWLHFFGGQIPDAP